MNKFVDNLPESIGGSIDPISEFPVELQLADKILNDLSRFSGGTDAHNLDAFELNAANALANIVDIENVDPQIARNVFHITCLHLQARAILGYATLETMEGIIPMPTDINARLKTRSGTAEAMAESFIALGDFFEDEGRKHEVKLWKGLALSCMAEAMIEERG